MVTLLLPSVTVGRGAFCWPSIHTLRKRFSPLLRPCHCLLAIEHTQASFFSFGTPVRSDYWLDGDEQPQPLVCSLEDVLLRPQQPPGDSADSSAQPPQ